MHPVVRRAEDLVVIDESLFLNGSFVTAHGSDVLAVDDSTTEQVIAHVRAASYEDIDRAVEAARLAQPEWAATPLAERRAIVAAAGEKLAAMGDEVIALIMAEVGTPRSEARVAQLGAAIRAFQHASEFADVVQDREPVGTAEVIHEPAGVIAAVTPWNYPLFLMGLKVAPALIAGCAVIAKPSELAPLSTMTLARVLAEAGIPDGVFALVQGDGNVGGYLAGHPGLDLVTFTGSVATGRRVAAAAAEHGVRTTLELGGKSASLVMDPTLAVEAARFTLANAMSNAGQTCAALTRLIVPRATMADVESVLEAECSGLVVGDPRDDSTSVGPLVSERERDRVRAMIAEAEASGMRIVAGGSKTPAGCERGWFVQPTVVVESEPTSRLAREEVFGPVLSVIAYDSPEHAVELAEETEFGLVARVWDVDDSRFETTARRLRVGGVSRNGVATEWAAPFGGVKASGYGRERGRAGIEEFLVAKAIHQ
ncbi:aldehyde dehydrogenase family protein [Amycolatopsis pithecellobii]|uniref:Aldehyde dehydrogenase family protein n=1 Tax=Amycolatopsis pithecellobii TaxID=664692 RepID=A0A6N7YY38_9PSEU|nr:aldehyde dehydrogenase family protein [Amycolatopsis pithecellobii]MTD58007.1 aldehyde dehydrogenase family protein [Amycolatopsis pithecellobii]